MRPFDWELRMSRPQKSAFVNMKSIMHSVSFFVKESIKFLFLNATWLLRIGLNLVKIALKLRLLN